MKKKKEKAKTKKKSIKDQIKKKLPFRQKKKFYRERLGNKGDRPECRRIFTEA